MTAVTTDLDTTDAQVYVTALPVEEIFADPTYQRPLDVNRASRMADEWDRRLAGIVEVSDRGPDNQPRYAVVDGQHRWAAARRRNHPQPLVANVHEGLNIGQEAALFDRLNRQRKQPNQWDHWKARRAAGDRPVLAIDTCVNALGLHVSDYVKDGHLGCISTLEKVAGCAGGIDLLAATLTIIKHAWGNQRAAYEAPIVHGLALVIVTFDERIFGERIVNALMSLPPQRIRSNAAVLRDSGTPGSLAKLTAVAILNQYNRQPGTKLYWPARWAGSLPKPGANTTTKVTSAAS